MEALKFGPLGHSTLGGPASPVRSKLNVFTSTKVPKFAGVHVTSWEQYRQEFDAIAQSNGWDDTTAALQLLSHLEGDALNVALLVPEARRGEASGKPRRATRTGLVWALTEHYGSLGRLADYRRQFEKTTRKEGEDPSIFAIALELSKPLGTWVTLHDSTLYVTGLLLAMTVVPCAGIWIVYHRRLPSGISLTVVECGRAMPTLRLGDLANRGQRELYRSTP